MLREDDLNTFKKIERDIEGISAKVLSKELKDLEANKLIKEKNKKLNLFLLLTLLPSTEK